MTYAAETNVPVERSRAEIERMVQKHGADQFISGWAGDVAVIGFRCNGRRVQFKLKLPDKADRAFTHCSGRQSGCLREPGQVVAHWEQACRARWRALALCIKAKLEAVAVGITTFEEEFLAHVCLPGGGTVNDHVGPAVEEAYRTGKVPALLPMLEGPRYG
jgi:hypothetical protein